ncbi:MAG TPA: cupredoxin domain-containing protein [Actinomycetota bacterium]|nr:cupredoxin domain-containing protein [Actinomycetota bacterium]
MSITTKPATIAALGIAAALALGACGGGGGGGATARPAPTAATADPATANPAATATALSIEAHEFSLSPSDLHAAAGSVAIHYTNAGAIQHTLVIDGVAGFKLDVPKAGDVDTATVKLEPGTYTLYCDIPGHRQAGMEDHLTVG